ncbi:hypothetical protein GJ496_009259 [Pomphorhynchus laevis]|nr:hypothetical protein GJ496_009259 [Pomphorhynchus laevis]
MRTVTSRQRNQESLKSKSTDVKAPTYNSQTQNDDTCCDDDLTKSGLDHSASCSGSCSSSLSTLTSVVTAHLKVDANIDSAANTTTMYDACDSSSYSNKRSDADYVVQCTCCYCNNRDGRCVLLLHDEPDCCYCKNKNTSAATLCRSVEQKHHHSQHYGRQRQITSTYGDLNDPYEEERNPHDGNLLHQIISGKECNSNIGNTLQASKLRNLSVHHLSRSYEEIDSNEKIYLNDYRRNSHYHHRHHDRIRPSQARRSKGSQTDHEIMFDDNCHLNSNYEDNDKEYLDDKAQYQQNKRETTAPLRRSLKLILCDTDGVYVAFLKSHVCFELMPSSGKVLVLDSALTIRKAFYALVFNNTRAALISTVSKVGVPQFTGVISISDFIELVTLYYRSRHKIIRELDELTIRSWKNQLNSNAAPRSVRALPGIAGGGATRHLISISPDVTLFDTCMLIERERIHRVPLISAQTNDFLYFVTLKRILRFLFLEIYNLPRPNFLDKTIDELGIGTYCIDKCCPFLINNQSNTPSRSYKKIYTINNRTTVIDALRLLVRTGVSALPIVDTTGRLRDLFSRFDVIHLAVAGSYTDLDRQVGESMKKRGKRIEAVLCCQLEETLITIMVRMVTGQVHRLVVVDKSRRVIGILSLSDLISFLSRPYTK